MIVATSNSANPWLIGNSGETPHELTEHIFTIGRKSDSNLIVNTDNSCSKVHAKFTWEISPSGDLEAYVEDLKTTNGTFIGSTPSDLEKIKANIPTPVRFGDFVRFGISPKTLYQFLETKPNAPSEQRDIIISPINLDQVIHDILGALSTPVSVFRGTFPDHILTEAIAETFSVSKTTTLLQLTGLISNLSDLSKQCTHASSHSVLDEDISFSPLSKEFDDVFRDVVCSLLLHTGETITYLSSNDLICALVAAESSHENMTTCVDLVLTRSKGRIQRLYETTLATSKPPSSVMINTPSYFRSAKLLTPLQLYSVLGTCLVVVIGDLTAALAVIESIHKQIEVAGEVVTPKSPPDVEPIEIENVLTTADFTAAVDAQHVSIVDHSTQTSPRLQPSELPPAAVPAPEPLPSLEASQPPAVDPVHLSLSAELEDLRRLKREAEAASAAESQRLIMKRVVRLFDDVLLRHLLHAFQRMKEQWRLWHHDKILQTMMTRATRSIVSAVYRKIRTAFEKWWIVVQEERMRAQARDDSMRQHKDQHGVVTGLREEILSLKAELYALSSRSDVAAALAAERVLNKELMATNQELRRTIGELEQRYLDLCRPSDTSAAARPNGDAQKKGAVRDMLIGREALLADSRKEAQALRHEVDRLQKICQNTNPNTEVVDFEEHELDPEPGMPGQQNIRPSGGEETSTSHGHSGGSKRATMIFAGGGAAAARGVRGGTSANITVAERGMVAGSGRLGPLKDSSQSRPLRRDDESPERQYEPMEEGLGLGLGPLRDERHVWSPEIRSGGNRDKKTRFQVGGRQSSSPSRTDGLASPGKTRASDAASNQGRRLGGSEDPTRPAAITRDVARKIVLLEVRRLVVALTQLEKEKRILKRQLGVEAARATEATLAGRGVQQRLASKDRGLGVLRDILFTRLGEGSLLDVMTQLEQELPGSSELLRHRGEEEASSSAPASSSSGTGRRAGNFHERKRGDIGAESPMATSQSRRWQEPNQQPEYHSQQQHQQGNLQGNHSSSLQGIEPENCVPEDRFEAAEAEFELALREVRAKIDEATIGATGMVDDVGEVIHEES